MAIQTTSRLISELTQMDEREAQLHARLLRRVETLEQRELRKHAVTVADLHVLQAALTGLQAKITGVVASAATPGAPTLEQLEAEVRAHDATAERVRDLIAARIGTLAHVEAAGKAEEERIGAAPRPRTFRLAKQPMKGADVRDFQRLLNRHYATWGINRHIAENGTYGRETQEAAAQIALGLGMLKSDYEHGITPALRVLIRRPGRRTARQKERFAKRRDYRRALRERYGAKARGDAVRGAQRNGDGHRESNGSATAPGGVAAAIRAHGGHFEHAIVKEAGAFGVDVALVCAVADIESGFTNVFGHDTVPNPIKSPPRPAPDLVVTKQLYDQYLHHRNLGKGAQGVGPMQLTDPGLQDEADRAGGCFVPEINIRIGAKHLARLIARHGLREGVERYNRIGATAYGTAVLKRAKVWEQRLAGAKAPVTVPKHSIHAIPGPDHRPAAGRPRTFNARPTPMKGADVRAFQRLLNQRFAAWGIGRRIEEDGVYGADTARAARQVSLALGLPATAYVHGVTPRLRVLIRTPSKRTAQEKQRARSKQRREYRARLRTRHGAAHPAAAAIAATPAGGGKRHYPLAIHGTYNGGVADHHAKGGGQWQDVNAVDINVPMGTAVLAVGDGTITRLGGAWNGGRGATDGLRVTLDTGDRKWFYTHLKEREPLKVGQKVGAGQLLGRSGAGAGVPHLHIASSAGDPVKLLNVR